MCAVLVQEQAQAARKRAAGTMDEYTFIAEDTEAADQAGSVPAIQQVSSEELYRKELAEEMQVQLLYTVNHPAAAPLMLICVFFSQNHPTRISSGTVLCNCLPEKNVTCFAFIGRACNSCASCPSALQNQRFENLSTRMTS